MTKARSGWVIQRWMNDWAIVDYSTWRVVFRGSRKGALLKLAELVNEAHEARKRQTPDRTSGAA